MPQNPVQVELNFYLPKSLMRVRGGGNFNPLAQNFKPDFNVTSPYDISISENCSQI
jgi:hypothetical protein